MTVSTRKGSGRKRLRGTGESGVGAEGSPIMAVSGRGGQQEEEVGEPGLLRPEGGAISVMERFRVSLTLATTLSTRLNGGNAYTSR